MKHVVAPVGISGSGKSTLYEKKYPDCVRICPDELRKALTGDISNQSRNREVFAAAYHMVDTMLRSRAQFDIYFDATNLDERAVNTLVEICQGHGVQITFVNMLDSENLKLCEGRVFEDLEMGKDRSNTLVQDDILARQQGKYYAVIPYIKSLAKKSSDIKYEEFKGE